MKEWKIMVMPKARRMPRRWSKELIKMMRLMPVFENNTERNLWRRRRQGRITHEKFKEAVRRMIKKHVSHEHVHE